MRRQGLPASPIVSGDSLGAIINNEMGILHEQGFNAMNEKALFYFFLCLFAPQSLRPLPRNPCGHCDKLFSQETKPAAPTTMNENCRTNILFVPIEQGCSIYRGDLHG
jgi:hypothetical protein